MIRSTYCRFTRPNRTEYDSETSGKNTEISAGFLMCQDVNPNVGMTGDYSGSALQAVQGRRSVNRSRGDRDGFSASALSLVYLLLVCPKCSSFESSPSLLRSVRWSFCVFQKSPVHLPLRQVDS
jgi:hypothetical protein